MVNWYKKAAEQGMFSFFEDDSVKGPTPQKYHSEKSLETLETLMDESQGFLAVESNLIRFKYDWKLTVFPPNKRIVTVKIGADTYVIDDFHNPYPVEVNKWLYDLKESDAESFYPGYDSARDFWKHVRVLYHATSEDNVPLIGAAGLNPMNRSRGISNRGTGSAVFMSENIDEIESYGPAVYEIDTPGMLRDGYTPEMLQESQVMEANFQEAVAHKLGVNFFVDREAGISESTFVCREPIPAKYLKRVK